MAGGASTNAKRGDQSRMGYENSDCNAGDPYGTALDLTSYTDARICAEVTPAFVSEEAEFRRVGCGGQSGFGTQCEIVNREYRLSLTGDVGYQNGIDRLLAQFMGQATDPPVEQTALQGDYEHFIEFAAVSNEFFGTFAYETSQSDVVELISTYVESVSISMSEVGQPLEYTVTLVSNDIEVSAPVNDNADLQSLAFVNDSIVVPACEDTFRIKAINDDGADTALAPADQVNILSFELEMERPLEVIQEITGGDCGGPSESGFLTGTFSVTFRVHTSNTTLSYQNWLDNDKYACQFVVEGSQIGTGLNETFAFRIPKMCLVEAPDYPITDAGFNEYSLTFRILDSNNVIPGFQGNALEFQLVNERAGTYLIT